MPHWATGSTALSPRSAAQFLCLHPTTLTRLLALRQLPFFTRRTKRYLLVGGAWLNKEIVRQTLARRKWYPAWHYPDHDEDLMTIYPLGVASKNKPASGSGRAKAEATTPVKGTRPGIGGWR